MSRRSTTRHRTFAFRPVRYSIGADFLSTVYICHLSNDDNESDWSMMYNYYKIAISPQEQTRALVAISSTSNKERLNQ